jgi:hypothetical protein
MDLESRKRYDKWEAYFQKYLSTAVRIESLWQTDRGTEIVQKWVSSTGYSCSVKGLFVPGL